MATYKNNDGLEVRFGSDIGKRGFKSGVTTGAGKRRELVLDLDLTKLGVAGTGFTADLNNDGTLDGFNPSNTAIPTGYVLDQVRIIEIVAAAGGGTGAGVTVGTFQENGTVVDADGILTNLTGTAGAQIGTKVASATGPWYVAPVKAGDAVYTAGRYKVILEYMTV